MRTKVVLLRWTNQSCSRLGRNPGGGGRRSARLVIAPFPENGYCVLFFAVVVLTVDVDLFFWCWRTLRCVGSVFNFLSQKTFFLLDWCCCFRSNDVKVSEATFFKSENFGAKLKKKTKRCWFFIVEFFWPGKSADKWIVSNLTLINPRVSSQRWPSNC